MYFISHPPSFQSQPSGDARTHGDRITFSCTDGRRIRGDLDNAVVVFCSDGVVSPPLKWPAQSGGLAETPLLPTSVTRDGNLESGPIVAGILTIFFPMCRIPYGTILSRSPSD